MDRKISGAQTVSGSDKSRFPPARVWNQNNPYGAVDLNSLHQISLQRGELLARVRNEDNIATKVNIIADLSSNISSTLEVMSRQNQERYDTTMNEIKKLREFFLAELTRVADMQDVTSGKIDGMNVRMATRDEIQGNRDEMRNYQDETRGHFAALRKQLTLLLGQQGPSLQQEAEPQDPSP
jgi:hypothetical protein